jgi:hypothetical protein
MEVVVTFLSIGLAVKIQESGQSTAWVHSQGRTNSLALRNNSTAKDAASGHWKMQAIAFLVKETPQGASLVISSGTGHSTTPTPVKSWRDVAVAARDEMTENSCF